MSIKWVLTEKMVDGAPIVKARLVARGFKEALSRTDSPTCSKMALRLCFAIAPTMGWDIQSLDISSAFLQGNKISRDQFLEPPVEFKQEGKVWKLNRCIYGLADAPRAWYEKVVEELRDLGGVLSRYDQSLFLWHVNGSLDGIVVLHVDDFIYCGSDSWLVSVVMRIEEKFEVGRQSYNTFKYLGLMVKQNSEFITVDQQAYTESLKPLVISAERARQIDEPLTKNEVAQLKSLSGQILWASSQTRPDVAYDSCVVGNYGKEPTVRSLLRANKCIQKLQMTSVKLFFPKLRDISQVKVLTFADASHASLPSGASQGGLIVFIECAGKVAPIMWQSKKLDRVVKSPFAAETLAQADVADAGVLVAKMLEEMTGRTKVIVKSLTDSQSLIDNLESSRVVQDFRLRVDLARLKEMIEVNEIRMEWIDKSEQLADPLTKAGASNKRLCEVLCNGRFP